MRGVYPRLAPTPRMPAGLVELMQGLARDVLQHNPPDVHQFCAAHLEKLLIIRDGRAPSGKRLTLEQKIKRAQEKVREKAELRRRKYDEDMKKYNQDMSNMGAGSVTEIDQDLVSREEKLISDEVKSSSEPIMEINLKAPVHHEQDIADSLEVEIFHKPVENIDLKNDAKVFEEVQEKEMEEQHNTNIEKEKIREVSKAQNGLVSEDKPTVTLADTSSSEQIVINGSISNDSNDHPRVRRGEDLEQNGENKEMVHEDVFVDILETHENAKGIFSNISEMKCELESVSNIIMVDNNQTDIINNNKSDNIIEYEKSASLFTNEVVEAVPVLQSKADEQVSIFDDVIERSVVETDKQRVIESNTPYESSVTQTIVLDTLIEEKKKTDVDEVDTAKEDSKENVILEEISKAVEHSSNKYEKSDCLTDKVTDNLYFYNSNTPENTNENHNENIVVTVDSTVINNTIEENKIIKNIDLTVTGDELEKKSDLKRRYTDKDIETKDNFEQKEDILTSNDEKIIEAVEKLNVCSDPVGINICTSYVEDGSSVNNFTTSENNEKSHIARVFDKHLSAENNSIGIESTIEQNVISSGIKILAKESTGVMDDNDPARDSAHKNVIVENTALSNGPPNETAKEIIKNKNESSEQIEDIKTQGLLYNQDISKEAEVAETQDDVTTISEHIKTDAETSSLGKCCSMDDSFIEECVIEQSSTESDDKSSINLIQNKENSNTMDLETAAITIQKVFRTFLFKSRESTFDDTGRGNSIDGDSEKSLVDFPDVTTPLNKERRTLGISRMDTVLQTVNEEKSLSLSTDDSSLSSAATTIQAHVRGFLTRNKLNSKTNSSSLVNSDGPSSTSFDNDPEPKANRTVLNIHIVPEGEHFLSRDESLLTSIELSLDNSPPSTSNLHPLGYDKSEPRKQLKREDAIQSISPPSNNSGKLSEDIDSVKDMSIIELEQQKEIDESKDEIRHATSYDRDDTATKSSIIETIIEAHKKSSSAGSVNEDIENAVRRERSLVKASSDEGDVVTPYEDKSSSDSDATSHLLHSGEFHDVVLPTKVLRGDTPVVREFKNVLVYFLIWNNSS